MKQERIFPNAFAARVFSHLPPHILSSLSLEQRLAFGEAIKSANQVLGGCPIDLRVSLPLGPRRIFVGIVAGPERRSVRRRDEERHLRPLARLGNLVVVAILAGLGLMLVY